jgi:hypothetical protein
MPILFESVLVKMPRPVSKMTTQSLIRYEAELWKWMTHSPTTVSTELNAIYREIEWRAQERDWDAQAPVAQKP